LGNLEKRIKEQKNLISGKIITVEVKNPEDARAIASSGIDIIQLDRMGFKEIRTLKKEIQSINPGIKIAVTGNINSDTVKEYAQTCADILVTSWPYYGEPSDLMVTVVPIFDVY